MKADVVLYTEALGDFADLQDVYGGWKLKHLYANASERALRGLKHLAPGPFWEHLQYEIHRIMKM